MATTGEAHDPDRGSAHRAAQMPGEDAAAREPGPSPADAPRVADVDRQRAAELLGAHAAAGTIDLTEYGDRLDAALRARTTTDLDAAVAGLPPVRTQATVDAERREAWESLRGYLVASVMFLAIWFLTTGPDVFFWPIWPILGMGIGAAGDLRTLLLGPEPAGVLEGGPVWPGPHDESVDEDAD